MGLPFEWNIKKAKNNLIKHKVSFEEAETVFNDPYLMTMTDKINSWEEDRYISVGYSLKGRHLLVVHTDREKNIRIISCRKADKQERSFYEENKR